MGNQLKIIHPQIPHLKTHQQVAVEAATLEQASETVSVTPKIKLKKNFGDEKLFADLEKLHKYCFDWRKANPGCDVKDGSPKFINFAASMYPEKVEEHLKRRIKCGELNFTTSDILT